MSIIFQVMENTTERSQQVSITRPKNIETMYSILARDDAAFIIIRNDALHDLSVLISVEHKTISHKVNPAVQLNSPDILEAVDACISDAFYLFINQDMKAN
jgi:hypothetical protein